MPPRPILKFKTPLTMLQLQRIIRANGWTQDDLAHKAKIHRSTVSMQFSRRRPVRDEHLLRYLSILERQDRQILVASWIRDIVDNDIAGDILDRGAAANQRVRAEIRAWAPQLDAEQRDMLKWWARELNRDKDFDRMFRSLCLRSGYQKKKPRSKSGG